MNTLKYKGYLGSAEVDFKGDCLHGKLLNIRDLITYEATSAAKLEEEFQAAVDDYLLDCEEQGVKPDVPFKGQFNIRVEPALHRDLATVAATQDRSLNDYVSMVLKCHREVAPNGRPKGTEQKVFVLDTAGMTSQARMERSSSAYSMVKIPSSTSQKSERSGWVVEGHPHAEH